MGLNGSNEGPGLAMDAPHRLCCQEEQGVTKLVGHGLLLQVQAIEQLSDLLPGDVLEGSTRFQPLLSHDL